MQARKLRTPIESMTDTRLKARDCRWIDVPGAADARGSVNFLAARQGARFPAQAPVLAAPHRARPVARPPRPSRDAARCSSPCNGGCRVHLDDGTVKETVTLDDPAKALYMAPWIWHELTDFAPADGHPGGRLDACSTRPSTCATTRPSSAKLASTPMIPFLDMKSVYAELKPELDAAYARVMESGWFVLGKEVEAFEQEYAAFCGTRHCVGLGNGLEALELVLRAWDIGAGRRGDRAVQHLHRDLARGDGGGRHGRAGRADAGRAQHRSRPHRGRDHAAHAGHHAGPSLRRAGRHGRDHGARATSTA